MHSIVAISSMTFFFIMFARFYVQTYGGVKQELSKIPVSFGCKLLVENKSLWITFVQSLVFTSNENDFITMANIFQKKSQTKCKTLA